MGRSARLVLCLALAVGAGGCSSYLSDRWHDAADVFTVSLGKGCGVKGRLGPLHAGCFRNRDLAGLRGGELFPSAADQANDSGDIDSVLLYPLSHYRCWGGFDYFAPDVVLLAGRHKDTAAFSRAPFFYTFLRRSKGPSLRREYAPQYTQMEAAAGLVRTVRIGFNPGELLDFLLGWTTLDLYRDDVGLDPEARSGRTVSADRQGIEQAVGQFARELRREPPAQLTLKTLTVRGNTAIAHCSDDNRFGQLAFQQFALRLRYADRGWRVVEDVTPARCYVK